MADLDADQVVALLLGHDRLRVYVRDGRITTIPARLARRRLLFDVVAQGFEPGVRYPERAVNSFLGQLYDDHAAMRRYLVDEGFLSRDHGEYWRSAGTVDTGAPPERPGRAGEAAR
jgi:hypothetical protein